MKNLRAASIQQQNGKPFALNDELCRFQTWPAHDFMRNPTPHNCLRALFFSWLVSHTWFTPTAGMAQTGGRAAAPPDSLVASAADSALLEWSMLSEYEVLRLRIQRWLTRNRASAPAVYTNVMELLQEAETLREAEDYVTAQLLLEIALELSDTGSAPAAPPSGFVGAGQSSPLLLAEKPRRWHMQREILAGVDLSRLEYALGSPELEQIFPGISSRSINNSGNPFAGLRFQLMRAPGSATDLRLLTLLKTSRDYDSGALEFAARHALNPEAFLHFENALEATAYRVAADLRYWQNASLLRAGINLGRNFRAEVTEEVRLRRYREETLYGPNYLQNKTGLNATYSAGPATRINGRYDYEVRRHTRFPVNDYAEHRVDASISQNPSPHSSVFIQNIWRTRAYPGGIPDSTFQNSYHEEFLRADLRFGLSASFALRVEGDLTLRRYVTPSGLTPDFLNARLNPQVEQTIWRDLQISAGYLFLLQVHGTRERQNPANTAAALNGGFYEDYYAHGLTWGVDWFSARNLLLSLSHTYEVRIYPHDPWQETSLPGIYSDYNNHSLLLFFSWKAGARWQMNAVANYDDQSSRADAGDKLRNTLFSLEVAYSF